MNAPLPETALRGTPLPEASLRQLFLDARTFNQFTDRPVAEDTLRELVHLFRWAPTAMNAQPARIVFVRGPEAKQRLKPALAAGNLDKTMAAPVTAIVAIDPAFHEHLPTQFPAVPGARDLFAGNAALAEVTALRNGSMQGAYLILAARALGLDAGPMSGFDNAKVDAEFFPDGKWRSNFLVNLGYGDPAGNWPRGPRLSFEELARIE